MAEYPLLRNKNIPIVLDLDDLQDVDTTGKTDSNVIAWNETSGFWEAISGSGNLTDLDDVELTSVQDGDLLKWSITNSRWENSSSIGDLGDLEDVDVASATNLQILTYNANAGGSWIPTTLPTGNLAGLSDVNVSGVVSGQLLSYDDGNWVHVDPPTVGVSNNWHTANNSNNFDVAPSASGSKSYAAGDSASALGTSGISIGTGASCVGTNFIAIGRLAGNSLNIASAISIGYNSDSSGTSSIALGANASALGESGIAIGTSSDGYQNSVAIGNDATANQTSIAIGPSATATNGQVVMMTPSGGSRVLNDGSFETTANGGVDWNPMASKEDARVARGGRKNLLMNADFRIWQRGRPVVADGSASYFSDRWLVWGVGSTSSPYIGGDGYGAFQSVTTTFTDLNWTQRIEGSNVYWTSQKKLTVSGSLYYNLTTSRTVRMDIMYADAKDDFWTGSTMITTADIVIPASADTGHYFEHTFDVVMPEEAKNGLQFSVRWAEHADLVNGETVGINWIQLEEGEEATSFERMNLADELNSCQRYYEYGDSWLSGIIESTYSSAAGQAALGNVRFSVRKRVVPTVVLTHEAATRFPEVVGTVYADLDGIGEIRNTNAIGQAYFGSSYTADAEL